MAELPMVHVVDDDEPVRDSLAFLLEAAGFNVLTYASALELLAGRDQLAAGCIVSDIRMPEVTGLDLVRRLKASGWPHPIILITGHADVPLAIEAVRLGVHDFIEKPFDDGAIVDAVRRALEPGLSPDDAVRHAEVAARLGALTPTERVVLDGLVSGMSNSQVA